MLPVFGHAMCMHATSTCYSRPTFLARSPGVDRSKMLRSSSRLHKSSSGQREREHELLRVTFLSGVRMAALSLPARLRVRTSNVDVGNCKIVGNFAKGRDDFIEHTPVVPCPHN